MKHVAPRGRKEAAAMAAQGHGAVVARRARRNLRDGAALAAPSTSSPSVAAGAAWFERGASRRRQPLALGSSGKDSVEGDLSSLDRASDGAGDRGSRAAGRPGGNGKSDLSPTMGTFGGKPTVPATPLVRVRFQLQYRCHSRQMLAIAGSSAPLGWSFLSIARNPLIWKEGDWWTIELNFPEGARVEYKYVVLEDQNWTKQADEAAEGLVPLYRPSGEVTEPDTEAIVRKMAIVAWQPGPNVVYTVPAQEDAWAAAGEGDTFVDEDGTTTIPIATKGDLWI